MPQWRDKLPYSPCCSPSTHGSKIKKLKNTKWTRDAKKKKIKRKKKKVGRQECLPPRKKCRIKEKKKGINEREKNRDKEGVER